MCNMKWHYWISLKVLRETEHQYLNNFGMFWSVKCNSVSTISREELLHFAFVFTKAFGVAMLRLGVSVLQSSSSRTVRGICRRNLSVFCASSPLVVRRHQPCFVQHRQHSTRLPFTSDVKAEPFLDGTSANFLEQLYEDWLQDPTSVHRVSNCNNIIGRLE